MAAVKQHQTATEAGIERQPDIVWDPPIIAAAVDEMRTVSQWWYIHWDSAEDESRATNQVWFAWLAHNFDSNATVYKIDSGADKVAVSEEER